MTIVSEKYQFVIGIDTHSKKHVLCLINNLGQKLAVYSIRVLEKDFKRMLKIIKDRTNHRPILFAIEGTSSYGETLTRFLYSQDQVVCEVKPPRVKSRSGIGKTDLIDAELAARSVLMADINELINPRIGINHKALRILFAKHNLLSKQLTMNKNALVALVRSYDIGIDARKPLSLLEIKTISRMRVRSASQEDSPLSQSNLSKISNINNARDVSKMNKARSSLDKTTQVKILVTQQAIYLAKSILKLDQDITNNKKEMELIIKEIASELLLEFGIGVVTASQFLCSYSYKGRIKSAAAFCALAGTNPLPASSGNVTRHRLNRNGDRALNHALDVVARTRMRSDPETISYTQKRIEQGLSKREIKRSLKRYIARSIFKKLEKLNLGID